MNEMELLMENNVIFTIVVLAWLFLLTIAVCNHVSFYDHDGKAEDAVFNSWRFKHRVQQVLTDTAESEKQAEERRKDALDEIASAVIEKLRTEETLAAQQAEKASRAVPKKAKKGGE